MKLQNARLCVEVAPPCPHGIGSRWSWGGFIAQVTLDGEHTFCAPESLDFAQGDGGQGLCHEFGIFRPVGFEDAPIGGRFPKIGVGLLLKPDDAPYKFSRAYEVEPFPIEVETHANRITFQSQPLPCNGYAFALSERLELQNDELHITCELHNSGELPIQTHEYRHNFLAFNGGRPNPNWRLRLAPGLRFKDETPLMPHYDAQCDNACGDEWSWPQAPLAPGGYVAIGNPESGPQWTLREDSTGQSISETLQLGRFEHFNLWCAPHIVSPEVFVQLDVAPGASTTWTRTYQFRGAF